MALGNLVPGSEINLDWRAVVVGGVVVGALCTVAVVQGWLPTPTPAGAGPVSPSPGGNEGPGIMEAGIPLLVGAPGAFLAGYLTRTENLKGAVEGMLSVPVGAAITVVATMIDQFLLFQGIGLGWQIEMVWRGVGAYAVIGVIFIPFACIIGAVLGWLGKFVRDAASDGIRVSWS